MTGDFPLSLGPGARPWALAKLPGPLLSTPGVDYRTFAGLSSYRGDAYRWPAPDLAEDSSPTLVKLDLTPMIHLAWISRVACCDRHAEDTRLYR